MKESKLICIPESVHRVNGFGTMTPGCIQGSAKEGFSIYLYGRFVASYQKLRQAMSEAENEWKVRHSKWALNKKWQPMTKGGFHVRFNHQTGESIVAVVLTPEGPIQTSWSLDGKTTTQCDKKGDCDLIAVN